MAIVATVPYASEAEANDYFDPLNYLYGDEWWAADEGASAYLWTYDNGVPARRLVITVLEPGEEGNRWSWRAVQGGPEDVTFNEAQHYLEYEFVAATTAAEARAAILAEGTLAATLSVDVVAGGGQAVLEQLDRTFFSGGVDPDADRLGHRLPALAAATRKIDKLPLNGYKADDDQVHEFPRKWLLPDDTWETEEDVSAAVKMATCEEAMAILKYGNTERYKMRNDGVKNFSLGVGGLNEKLAASRDGDMLSGEAMNFMRPYMRRSWLVMR